MKFQSTRDESAAKFSAAQVIKQGLAADGGLFVPEEIPRLPLTRSTPFARWITPPAPPRSLASS
jgi:threonine synthase